MSEHASFRRTGFRCLGIPWALLQAELVQQLVPARASAGVRELRYRGDDGAAGSLRTARRGSSDDLPCSLQLWRVGLHRQSCRRTGQHRRQYFLP